MSNFRPVDRATPYLLPPSVDGGCRLGIWRVSLLRSLISWSCAGSREPTGDRGGRPIPRRC